MERIANPVTGSTDDGSMPREPPTRLMVACRYALALLIPGYLLASAATGPVLEHDWWLLVPFWAAIILLGAGAHGSWWRVAPWSAWQASLLVEAGLLLVGLVVTAVTGEELAIVLASTLLVGAVLGFGVAQRWQSLQRRRP